MSENVAILIIARDNATKALDGALAAVIRASRQSTGAISDGMAGAAGGAVVSIFDKINSAVAHWMSQADKSVAAFGRMEAARAALGRGVATVIQPVLDLIADGLEAAANAGVDGLLVLESGAALQAMAGASGAAMFAIVRALANSSFAGKIAIKRG